MSREDGQSQFAAPLLASAPVQDTMDMGYAPSAPQPWEVGWQNIYEQTDGDHMTAQAFHFPAPTGHVPGDESAEWLASRRKTLLEWGQRREKKMHRQPKCLMDQMVSGSGLYPIRLLDDSWLTQRELGMVQQLERVLEGTLHATNLARDMLTPLIYGVDVRIVLDNSGSMRLDMFGNLIGRGFDIDAQNYHDDYALDRALQNSLPPGWFVDDATRRNVQPARGGPSPFKSRWWFARDALRKWIEVYKILEIDPWVYLLNQVGSIGSRCRGSQLEEVFRNAPAGSTAMTEALQLVLEDHKRECPNDPLLILAITDGEANDMVSFNMTLDMIQNKVYGDVQVCLLGVSLVKKDIEWFENEECDDTRIRTVEAFEVENRQIQLREVVRKEGGYNFDMHTYRVLLTNYFPADYDYEAHLQNLRHRIYITLHGRDRWCGIYNPCWYFCVSQVFCSACFVLTGAHCCGWCQGNDCGKWQLPDGLEGCCGED
eukprot:TRINITY_DN26359_c0_g1_i1.p1 TRINITY_DN26359_c0_g1~~TRINITY_DN26359_c0_g1_i1.p1  ORF type:complete len:501 (+),score=63.78 TRINITY_DN26359_c0_g1_i1:50-1504(+)